MPPMRVSHIMASIYATRANDLYAPCISVDRRTRVASYLFIFFLLFQTLTPRDIGTGGINRTHIATVAGAIYTQERQKRDDIQIKKK